VPRGRLSPRRAPRKAVCLDARRARPREAPNPSFKRPRYDALESLYYKYAKKLELACVVDAQLHEDAAPQASATDLRPSKKTQDLVFQRNEDLAGAVDPWQPGALAVVAGPPHFAEQVSAHLTAAKGYPAECVVYF